MYNMRCAIERTDKEDAELSLEELEAENRLAPSKWGDD